MTTFDYAQLASWEMMSVFGDGGIAAMLLGSFGLLLDIIGVAWLYLCTSTKRIEAELSYKLIRASTDEDGEWLESISFQEHLSKLDMLQLSIKRNRRNARTALGLILLGFVLQLVGGWL